MKVALLLDQEKVTCKFQCIDNCTEHNEEGIIINLHPNFVIAQADLHTDSIFPWMEQGYLMAKENIDKINASVGNKEGPVLLDIHSLLGGYHEIDKNWKIVKKIWQLKNAGQDILVEKMIDSNYPKIKEIKTHYDVIFNFMARYIGQYKYSVFEKAMTKCSSIVEKFEPEFKRLCSYYESDMQKDHMNGYLKLFTEYFLSYSEYEQTLLYVINGTPYPDDHHAVSTDFRKVNMFYGNAYEVLTSNIEILACLNNIDQGRSYNLFNEMTYSKYKTIDKANRANPFIRCAEFYTIVEHLESTLRNASHHNSMKLINDGKNIEFRSGGTGAMHNISYGEYLYKCNQSALSAAILLMLELTLCAYNL